MSSHFEILRRRSPASRYTSLFAAPPQDDARPVMSTIDRERAFSGRQSPLLWEETTPATARRGSLGAMALRWRADGTLVEFFVYVMSELDALLYTGFTNDLRRRVAEHKAQTGDAFTHQYHCTKLVYFERFLRPPRRDRTRKDDQRMDALQEDRTHQIHESSMA